MSGWIDPATDPKVVQTARDAWKKNNAAVDSAADLIATKRAQNDLVNQPIIPTVDALALAMAWQEVHDFPIHTTRVLLYIFRHTTRSGVVAKSRNEIAAECKVAASPFTRAIRLLKNSGLVINTPEERLSRDYPYQVTQRAMELPEVFK